MKKAILSMAVASAALFSFQALAQQSAGVQTCPVTDAACYTTACNPKADTCAVVRGCNPFTDLNLSQDQKAKVKELRKKYAPPTDRQIREQAKGRRADYLKELKTILTPEQYMQFLENNYVNAPAGPRYYKGVKGKRHDKGVKCDRKDKKDKKEKKDKK